MKSRSHRGFSLLEVLVTIVIISVGLLGMAALHARAQQAEMESYQRSQALILLQDMVNRINTNRAAVGCYQTGAEYVGVGTDPVACSGYGTSSTRALADADMEAWAAALRGDAERLDGAEVGAMIGGRGCVTANFNAASYDVVTVTVAWQGAAATYANPDNDCAQGLYGDDDGLRRVVSATVRMAKLD